MNYEHDYVEIDDFGIVKLLCMRCENVVGGRTYIEMESKTTPGKTEKVISFQYHSNIRFRPVSLSDNSEARLIICVDCANEGVNEEKAMDQIKRAWRDEALNAGYSQQQVDNHDLRVENLEISSVAGDSETPVKFEKGGIQ